MTPQESTYNAVKFNGFHVIFYNHETRRIEQQDFPTVKSVTDRGFEDGFPEAKEFAADLFDVFGDTVGSVKDNDGAVLYDNMKEMQSIFESMTDW